MRSLFDTDNPAELERPVKPVVATASKRADPLIHPDSLLTWLKKQTVLYPEVTITDMTTSFQNGSVHLSLDSYGRID